MSKVLGYARHAAGTQPEYLHAPYRSTAKRSPSQPLILLPHTLSEITGPVFGREEVRPGDEDLTKQHAGNPIGERIFIGGRVLDEGGRPVRNTLVEVWQCNSAGRYAHVNDQHDAPLDPNFTGCGRTLTDDDGRYRFQTIKPAAYPWGNHEKAWRPAHVHFSLFGPAFATRVVTQMYFPGDPMLAVDPIFNSVPDERARQRMVSALDWDMTTPQWALGYRFDIVLRGPDMTPVENAR